METPEYTPQPLLHAEGLQHELILAREEPKMFSPYRIPFIGLVLLALAMPALNGFPQSQATNYRTEIEAARAEVIETDSLTIKTLDLGEARPGINHFSAVVTNKTANILTLAVDLRAEPSLWFRNMQRAYPFLIWPHGETTIEASYEFVRLADESTLRVRFFFPAVKAGGATDFLPPFFGKTYFLGKQNPAADVTKLFERRDTKHFQVYCARTSPAMQNVEAIGTEREAAFEKISKLLEVNYPEPIRLVLYSDAESKLRDTGHTGNGLACDNNLVEIYGKLDPYHELTHVLSGRLGDPPAMSNEGLAVYVSESMGADALKQLGSPGLKRDDAVAAHRKQGQFILLDELFALTDIGPDSSRPTISFPEAGSFVKFLILNYGLEKFRQAYKSLENSDSADSIRKNRETFRTIYGGFPADMERGWLATLPSPNK